MKIACSFLTLLALAGGTLAAPPPARAQPAAPSPALPTQTRQQAQRLFEEGQTHYDLGEYDQAIARFRQAYALSSAPLLLFNIAQAHRLKGDCRQALEVYRHFVRIDPASPQRASADEQIARLGLQCGRVPALAGPGETSAAPSSSTPAPRPGDPPSRLRTRVALILLGSGLALGGTAVGVHIWNDRRHQRWSEEDRRLLQAPGDPSTAGEYLQRQQRNDRLFDSIRTVDRTSAALGILAASLLVGAASSPLWPAGGPEVAAAPGALTLSWRLRWP